MTAPGGETAAQRLKDAATRLHASRDAIVAHAQTLADEANREQNMRLPEAQPIPVTETPREE